MKSIILLTNLTKASKLQGLSFDPLHGTNGCPEVQTACAKEGAESIIKMKVYIIPLEIKEIFDSLFLTGQVFCFIFFIIFYFLLNFS